MPTTPSRRARNTNNDGNAAVNTPSGSSGRGHGQGQQEQTPTNSNNGGNSSYDTHNTRLRSATRSAAAAASASHPTGIGSGTWSTSTSPTNSFITTPTRPPRRHSGVSNSGSGNNGHNDWSSLGVGSAGGSGSGGSGSGGGSGAPGSASSVTSASNSTSRQLRGPPLPNPQVTLKRSSGSSGSLSGSGHNSFSATMASLAELSPVAASGSRTPNSLGRKSQPSASNQSMRTIPSPFANSPASWLETSFLASPIKGIPISAGSISTSMGVSGNAGGGPLYVFETGSALGASGDKMLTPVRGTFAIHGENYGFDSNCQSEVDFFVPAEIHRDRSTVDSMRAWRTDAMHQHMYKTAAYWGDKVLSITEDSNDVFWLSQVYYLMGEYGRAINLLRKQKLLESSVACRFLAIQCMIRTEKWSEALEYLGDENQWSKEGGSDNSVNNADGGIKLEASMCYLRGIVYKNMNNIDRAKECFKEALQIDVKCYDALDTLISNSMMTTSEERELIEGLKFDKQLHNPDAMFVKMLYQSKLKKYDHLDEQEEIYKTLAAKFQTENADLLHSKAEAYFTQCCFDKCLECTKRILELDKFNLTCVPMHLVSLYELNLKNDLFAIAHELVDQHPKHAIAWFGVGVYYYLVGNFTEARRYFGKASTIDSHYGPAWIGFGHSFALEGEHDQAIAAYATSMKLFQGSHLGSMYIGMQHLQQNNVLLAQKYLTTCLTICDSDPLLLNEIAVVHYNFGQYEEAVQSLLKVIDKLQRSQRKNIIWETTWLNLAHSYRKLGNYSDAE
ncbi:anaphase promoting complex subunit cdc16, partial [Modicella reniformis]